MKTCIFSQFKGRLWLVSGGVAIYRWCPGRESNPQ